MTAVDFARDQEAEQERDSCRERINLVVPRHPTISEAWLDRHASAIRTLLTGVSTYEKPSNTWLNDMEHVQLGPRAPMLRRYGIGRLTSMTARSARSQLKELDSTGTIVHYANFLKLLGPPGKILPDVATLVYVHGFDITWSPFRRFPVPYKSYGNTPSYVESLIELSSTTLLVANSKTSRQHLIDSGFPADRVEVCYLPVDVQPTRASANLVSADDDTLRLVYVGRFVDFKGPVETVRAVALARSRGIKVQLTMVGDGELRDEVENTIEQLGAHQYINLVGFVPNDAVHRHLRQSDGFLLHNKVARKTGQTEAFGYAHAEALANGLPVLTATAGAQVEYLDDEVNSLLVEPGDIEAQAETIRKFAEDKELRTRLAAAAVATTDRLFSPLAHRSRVLQLLEKARSA